MHISPAVIITTLIAAGTASALSDTTENLRGSRGLQQGQKGARLERWLNVPYNDGNDRVMLDSLKRLPSYPSSPDEAGNLQNNILETLSNQGDDYGLKLWTYFVSPVTARCNFYIASDDNGELWLSPNTDSSAAVLIASVTGNGADGWTLPRQWFKYSSQKSGEIDLVQGEARYLEAIMKEGGGGDNLAIGWECPGIGQSLDVISTDYTVLEPPDGPSPTPPPPPPAPPTAFPPGQKGARLETWRNVPYNDGNDRVMLDSLKRLPSYPASPDEAVTLQNNVLESQNERGDDYGSRLWAYFVSPVTATCNFYIASDDNGELRLSPNTDPSQAVLIASVMGNGADGWTLPRQWFKYVSQKSGEIDLVQGSVRYLEAIMKEGGGGDNLAIGWECPGIGQSLDVISTDYTVLAPPDGPSPPTPTAPPPPPPPPPQPTNLPPAPPTSFPPGQNGAFVERWLNVPYNDGNDRVMLDSLKRLSSYPSSPDEAGTLQNNILETPSNQGDDYGLKLWTYFVSPVTARCNFYIASDDNGELWLSPNTDSSAAVLIASVIGNGADGWTLPRQWSKYQSQKSAEIDLVQGEVRYLEAIMKEGGGGDNLAIGWECPGIGQSLDVISTDYTVLAPPDGPSPPTPTAPPPPPPPPQPTNPPPAPPTAFPPGQKGARLETWRNVPYNDGNDRVMLDSLKRLPSYPASPDEAVTLQNNVLETQNERGDDYGSRLWAYFVSPVTATCNFYIASDDNGELRLSPNTDPSQAVLIASVMGNGADGWTLPRQWFKYVSQKSGEIDLVQGSVRYLEAIMKEGGGGDNLAIGWECPGIGQSLDVISTDYTVLAPPDGPSPPTPTAPPPPPPPPGPTTCPADREGPNCEFAAQTYSYTTNNDCNVRVTNEVNGPPIIEHDDNVVIKFWAFGDMPYDQEATPGNERSCCQESGGLVGCAAGQGTCNANDCGTDPDLTNNACSFGGTSFRCAPGCVFEGREYSCWRNTIVPFMNSNAQDSVASFGFFAGDFIKGNGGGDSGFCNPDSFASRRALFDSMNVDVLLTPGDNDWNECNGFDSSNNNNVIRRMYRSFFASQTTFSRDFRSLAVPGYPARPPTIHRDGFYPELFYYVWNDIVFIGVSAPAGWEPPSGRNKSWIRDSLARIDNDYPNFANEAQVCTGIRSVVLLSHTRYFNDARPEIDAFFGSCGRGGGAVPLLNVKGNHHDYEYCQRGGSSSNTFEMVTGGDQGTSGNNEESDPHLVTILRDPKTGDHYFRVDRNDNVSNGCSGFN